MNLDSAGAAALVLSVAARVDDPTSESLEVRQRGKLLPVREMIDAHGTRLHLVSVKKGDIAVRYTLDVAGRATPAEATEAEEITYLRPSRYCESDTLGPIARREFRGLAGEDLLFAVSSWVGDRLSYVPGSSQPTDGAVSTLLASQGVCRDYAHLVVALLRALDVPARVVSVYAPGLFPMDFHAVAEAAIDGRWCVVDATTLAPRSTMLRIATGRDASDTAFLSVRGAAVSLTSLDVLAITDVLPTDDLSELVSLG